MQRHTKIIATLGPAVAGESGVGALIEAGIDVARLNFSHGDHDFHRSLAEWVRAASKESGRTVALMQDIQGPKLRVGEFAEGAVTLRPGQQVTLVPDAAMGSEKVIPVGYEPLLRDVVPGDRVQLADGLIRCEVVERTGDGLLADVRVGGVLSDHKGVAFPDSTLTLDIVTPKDEVDLAFGKELGVDYVAASFVRNGDDVRKIAALAGDAPIVAKIELAQAYENLDDIIEPSAAVMVARGDLGVQLPWRRSR
jgi:pyruvate kinase